MKNILLMSFGFFSALILFGQTSKKSAPFILQGKLENHTDGQVFLFFKDGRTRVLDTIQILANGSFYLKTFKVKKPLLANLVCKSGLLSDLYIAPGYSLTVSGEANHFLQTKKIAGYGAAANQYLFARDAFVSKKENYLPEQVSEKEILLFIQRNQHGRDSLFTLYLDKKAASDQWFGYFKKVAWFDNRFSKLNYLLNHAIDDTTFNYEKMVRFLAENFDKAILSNLYREEYLISDQYETTLYYYPFYLQKLYCRKHPNDCDNKNVNVQLVEAIANNYTGKIKEVYLFKNMNASIMFSRSFKELNVYKADFFAYMSNLKDKADKDSLERLLVKMENTLLKTQVGIPAPMFAAEDSAGRRYTLTDFAGKVIYLDLWASWCGPCRLETPYLEKVVEKYRNDNRIAIVSVAVLDKMGKWKEAVDKDKPSWLQLFDTNGGVQQAYVANSIPKFILIDKKGNIVNFDSPFPRSGAELENLLESEMAK